MGSFDATCALSRLPISGGDPTFAFAVSGKAHAKGTYDLLTAMGEYDRAIELQRDDGDDMFSARRVQYALQDLKDRIIVAEGEYDTYGWVDDDRCPNPHHEGHDKYPFEQIVLIHRHFVDYALEMPMANTQLPEPYKTLYNVIVFAFVNRCQLFGNVLLGDQHRTTDEMTGMAIYHDEIAKFSRSIAKQMESEGY